MDIVADHHSHQFNGPAPAAMSPRSQESLADLQRRRNQTLAARNEAVAAEFFAGRDLHLATMRGNVAEMLGFTRALQAATAKREAATAAYLDVVAEIQGLLAVELDGGLVGMASWD